MSDLGFRMFDTDNHYYESTDAFTRHMDPKMAPRAMQWAEIDGETRLLVGGKICHYFPNPTNDPTWKPGNSREVTRGNNPDGLDFFELEHDFAPARPDFFDRDARLALMDELGIEGIFAFPSLATGMEEELGERDPEACTAAFSALNRWMDEDWGFHYQERIFAAPYITLVDPDWAVQELEWALARGAVAVSMVSGPIKGPGHYRSPGDLIFDPFWARANEAGIVVGYHGVGTTMRYFDVWGADADIYGDVAFKGLLEVYERSQRDTFSALIGHGVFHRFPNLRVMSVENRLAWIPQYMEDLSRTSRMLPTAFPEDPVETFRRHCWFSCTPAMMGDLLELRDAVGAEKMLMGSDYPHAEGLENPGDFVKELDGFSAEEIRLIMRENGLALTQPSKGPTL